MEDKETLEVSCQLMTLEESVTLDESVTREESQEDILPPPQAKVSVCYKFSNWLGSMYERFDKPFMTFFIVQNMNHGLWTAVMLATNDYYKAYLHVDPGEMQLYIAIIHLPWSLKIIFGIISDNLPICGTKRKSYLIIMGVVQFLCIFSLSVFLFEDPLGVALILGLTSTSEAFINVVSDAIMVIQSRKDPQYGSQDFVTLIFFLEGVGGGLGATVGGLITQYAHPKWVFFGYSFLGLFVTFFALKLTSESEMDGAVQENAISIIATTESSEDQALRNKIEADQVEGGFCFTLKKNMILIGRTMIYREMYFIIFFFIMHALLNPNIEDFTYFF